MIEPRATLPSGTSVPKKRLISRNKRCAVYESSDSESLILHYFDIEGKPGSGAIQNRLNEVLFSHFSSICLENHFVKVLNMKEQLVVSTDPLRFSVIIHNLATGCFAKRFGLSIGSILPFFIPEYKMDEHLLSRDHIVAFGWLGISEMKDLHRLLQRINDFLSGIFLSLNMRLGRYALRFGFCEDVDIYEQSRFILGDSFDLDTMNAVDSKTGQFLTIYEVAERFGIV